MITDNRELMEIGRALRHNTGEVDIVGREVLDGVEHWVIAGVVGIHNTVPVSLRPSWARYLRRGMPRGRKPAQVPSERITLYLPAPIAKRIPTPRQAHIKQWIDNGLMAHEMTEYLAGGQP